MKNAQDNIVYAMDGYIFNSRNISPKILSEVPFFKRILQENKLEHEVFHGYANKINDVWFTILSDSFKRLIYIYNKEYEIFREKEYRKKQLMISFADDTVADKLIEDLGDIEISPNISSLIKGIGKTKISSIRKGPSKRKSKK